MAATLTPKQRPQRQQAGGVKPTPPAVRTQPTGPTPGFIVGKAFFLDGKTYNSGDLFVPDDHNIAERRLRLLVEHRRLTVKLGLRK